jgi:hypothetical protein
MGSNRKIIIFLLCFLVAGVWSYFVYEAGINRAMGRSAYVNSTFVRLEQKCLASNDMECLKVYWRMGAGAAAESARVSNAGFGPNSVGDELDEYINWVNALPKPTPSKK